jgi:thymidylate kinase
MHLYPANAKSLVRGVVLEGCSCAGKTSMLKAIKRRQAASELERSVVILSEHYSQALQAVGNGYEFLTREEHRELLSDRVEVLERLQHWSHRLALGPSSSRGIFFALERFHLNHRLAYSDDDHWVTGLEERLIGLHAVCALLTVSAEHVPQRFHDRFRRSGKTYRDKDIDSAAATFLEHQEQFVLAAKQSRVPTMKLKADHRDWDRLADDLLGRVSIAS